MDDNTKGKKSVTSYNYSGDNKTYSDGRGRTAHRTIVRFVKLLNVLFVAVPFMISWKLYYSHMLYQKDFSGEGNWLVLILFVVIYFLLAHLYSGFLIHLSRISEIIYAQVLGVVITDGIMFIVMWLLIRHIPNIPILLITLAGFSIWFRQAFQCGPKS